MNRESPRQFNREALYLPDEFSTLMDKYTIPPLHNSRESSDGNFSIWERIGKFVLCANRKVITNDAISTALPFWFFRGEIEKGYADVLLT